MRDSNMLPQSVFRSLNDLKLHVIYSSGALGQDLDHNAAPLHSGWLEHNLVRVWVPPFAVLYVRVFAIHDHGITLMYPRSLGRAGRQGK